MFAFFNSGRHSRRRAATRICDLEALEVRSLLSAVVAGLTIDGDTTIVLPEIDGQELLAVSDGVATTKFYTTDGTVAGTVQYAELPVVIDQPLQEYVVNNGQLIFAASDPAQIGNELWRTDGTTVGTALVKDINNQQVNFYVGGSEESPAELWVNRNADEGSMFQSKVVFEQGITTQWHSVTLPAGDYAYWSRTYVDDEPQAWSSRRTESVRVRSSDPSNLTVLGNEVFFVANDNLQLFKTDGTETGTVPIGDLGSNTFTSDLEISDLVTFDDYVYFLADTSEGSGRDYQLFRTDGTAQPPTQLTQINPLTPIAAINNQLVVYGLQDDETLGLATINDATDTTPHFFYTFPAKADFGANNRLDGFFVDGHQLYFNHRVSTGQYDVMFGTGKDRYTETFTRENTAFLVANVGARTVTEVAASLSVREAQSYQFTYQQSFDAVSIGGVSVYIDADDILRRTDGQTVTTIADRVVHGPVVADGDAYFIASEVEGDGFPDIYQLNGATGQVTALDIQFRDTLQLSELSDALYIHAHTETSSTLLRLDEAAQSAAAPVVLSPLSQQTVNRGTVQFGWNPIADADFYELRITKAGGQSATQRFDDITNTQFEFYADSGDYTFLLRARSADGTVGQWTSEIPFTVGLEPAPEIINPTNGTPQTEGQVLLRWRRQSVADAYEVRIVSVADDDAEKIVADYISDQPFVFQELTAGNYRLEVNGAIYDQRFDDRIAERSEMASHLFTVDAGPMGPAISSPGAGLAPGITTLTWQPLANAISYDVVIWSLDNPDAVQQLIDTPVDFVDSFDFSHRTIKLAGVTETSQRLFLDGGAYVVEIRGHLPDGRLTAPTLQTLSVATSQNLSFIEIDQQGQHGAFRWTPVPGAIGYQVWISQAGNSVYQAGAFLQQETVVGGQLASLLSGDYHMYVRARMSGVTGDDPASFVYLPWVDSPVFTLQAYNPFVVQTNNTAAYQKTLRPTIQWYDYQADNYELVLIDSATQQEVYRKTGIDSIAHIVDTSLTNGRSYEVWVRAHFDDGSATRWGNEPATLVTTLASVDAQPTVTFVGRELSWTLLPEVAKHGQNGGHSVWIQKIADDGSRTSEVTIGRVVVGLYNETSVAVNRAIMNLSPGNYVVRVRGEVDYTYGPYSQEVFFTIGDSPALPPSLTYDGDTLRWTALSGSRYNLQGTYQLVIDEIDTDGNIVETGVYDGLIGNIEFTPELPSGRFQASVRAYYQQGGAEFSNTVLLDDSTVPVTSPTLTTAPNLSTDGRPLFEWTAVDNAVRYEIEIVDEASTVVVFDSSINTTQYQPSTPLPSGQLTFRVRAVTAQQTTAWSAPHTFEVFNSPVAFTNGLNPGFDQTVDFEWEDRGVDVTYELYIQQAGVSGAVYYRRALSTTSHELETPLAVGQYVAWMRAWNPDGSRSRWGTGNPFRIAGRPELSVTGNVVAWPVFAQATRYELWVDQLDENGARIGSKVFYDNSLTTLQATLADLSTGNYAVWLRAIKLDGTMETRSLWSSRTTFEI